MTKSWLAIIYPHRMVYVAMALLLGLANAKLAVAQGLNLEIPYEMVEVPLDTAGANSITYESTSVRIDPAKYDGVANVYFEVDVYAYGGGNKTITLVDESAVQYTSIPTGSVGASGNPKRLRSASFTLNASARTYKVKLGKNVTIYRARILIRQTAATKTVVQIPFLNWENRAPVSTELNNAYIISAVTSNYEVQSAYSEMRYRWRKDSAQYATISTYRWDVLANVTAANTTGYVSLFNSTHNTQVAASELSWTETAITRKSVTFAGNAANFAELDDFQPLGKRTTTSGGNLQIYKADLYIELTSLSRAEVYQRVGGRHNTLGLDEIFNDGHVLYDATRYSNPIVSFEAVGVYTDPANYAVYLYDHGVNDDGNTGGSNVSSSIVTGWNNMTQSRQRSSRLTLTNNNRYIIATDKVDTNGSARLTISQAFIVISAFASAPSGTPTITSVSPTSGLQGTNASVTISGTNLIGATLSTSWSGLTFTQVNWNGAGTSVTATFNIAGTAALGTPTIQLTASGGNTTTQAFSITPPPSITSLSPTSAPVGDSVTITGQGFGASQGTSVVTINGTAATTISTWSATSIQATVPSAATTTGSVAVNVAGVPSNNVSFTVPPKITSLMPPAAAIASPITISGTTFGSSGTVTFFNGVAGNPTGWNSTTITVPVPANTTTGPVVVTVAGVASNGVTFAVAPKITSISPGSATTGTSVTVTGTNFGDTGTITFNGAAGSPTNWTGTSITVSVPANAFTGPVVVTVGGAASNNYAFTTIPSITTLSPSSGGPSTYVTLTGTAFGPTQGPSNAPSTVTFNGATANPSSWSNTKIVVPVPNKATTGPVVVAVGGQASNEVAFSFSSVGSISGFVTRASDNAPVSGVAVQAAQSGILVAAATSAADGSYSLINLSPGTYDVSAYPAAYLRATKAGNLVSANQVTTVQLSLAKPSITTLSPSSGPVGTAVTVKGSSFGAAQGSSSVTFNGVTATPAAWSDSSISVNAPAGATTGLVLVTVESVASNSVTFTVGTGSLNGTVTQSGSGTPVTGATIELLQSNTVKGSGTTISNGTYTISTVIPGTYDLRFSSTGLGTVVTSGNVINAGSTTTVNAALPAPGGVAGRVTKSDGTTGISSASIRILLGSIAASTVVTDGSGNYSSPSLSPGTYSIEVSATGYAMQSRSGITVVAGATSSNDFSLNGQSVISYTYDSLGRLTGVSDSLGDSAAYSYDAVGNLLSIVRNSSSQVSITGFTPSQGTVGTTVQINGTGFNPTANLNTVRFNGTTAVVNSATATELVVIVPAGATSGTISVTSPAGSASSSATFTVTANNGQPTITSFSPALGLASTSITISGTNFDTVASNNRVMLNASFPTVVSATSTSITTSVPSNASSGRIKVATSGGEAVSVSDFFVVPSGYSTGQVVYTGRTSVGSSTHVSINSAGGIGLLLFDGTVGQGVSVNVTNSTICASISMLSPTGDTVVPGSCGGNSFFFVQVLPSTGTYTLLINPGGSTGSLDIQLTNVVDLTGTITIGGPAVATNFSVPGQAARLMFNGTAGQRVSLEILPSSVSSCVSILNPDQTTLVPKPCPNGSNGFIDTQTLPWTGTYAVYVYDSGTTTGSLSVRLNEVPADFSVSASPGGTPVTLNIGTPGQNGKISFSGTAGQRVSVQLSAVSISGSSVKLQQDPASLPLTAGQQYSIEMKYYQASSGSVARLRWSSPSTPKQIIPQNRLTPPGGVAGTGLKGEYYSNTTVSGTPAFSRTDPTINFDWGGDSPGGTVPQSGGSNWSARWTGQIQPQYSEQYTLCAETDDSGRLWFNGNLVLDHWVSQGPTEWCYNLPTTLASQSQSTGSGYIDTIQLPATGTYTILVDPNGAATGSMTVTLNNVPADFAATTTPGAGPVTVNIGTPGQNGQVSFSGTAGQRISLQTTGMSISGGWVKIQQNSALLPFTAGQQYSIEMQYYQASSGSVARLRWSSSSTQKQIIPQTQLTPAGGPAGTGLKGEYYSNTSLTGTPTLTRTDATVNFDWGGSTPGGDVPTSNWSARSTGQIQAQYSEQYTLCTETDDGARLYVNGSIALDHWEPQGPTEWCFNTPTILASQHQSGSGYIDTIQLPVTGMYTIIVDPDGDSTGSLTFVLNDVPADFMSTITPGGPPVTVDLGTPGRNGQISFSGTAGQQVSLQMSGVSISGSWVTIQQNPTLLPLTAGQQYSVEMQYFQGGSGSVARLKWSSPSTLKQVIPQTQLTPAGGAAGTGLKGDYYSNTTLSGTPTFTRTDPTVNFDWSGASPGSSMPGSNWSARWTGQIQAQYTEQYTVCTETDDGARLWVNGTLVLDHWVGQGPTEWCYNTPSNVVSQHQSGAGSISNVTLPATGNYTIIVDPDAAATGSMTLTLTSP